MTRIEGAEMILSPELPAKDMNFYNALPQFQISGESATFLRHCSARQAQYSLNRQIRLAATSIRASWKQICGRRIDS